MAKDQVKNIQVPPGASAPEGWEEEQTSFPPYWNPSPGKWFRGVVLAHDIRDPEFPRFLIRASLDTQCARGPADEAEEVTVKAGDTFTISDYVALPLKNYFGYEVHVIAKEKIKGGQGNVWLWKLMVSPETKRLVAERLNKELQSNPLAGEIAQ